MANCGFRSCLNLISNLAMESPIRNREILNQSIFANPKYGNEKGSDVPYTLWSAGRPVTCGFRQKSIVETRWTQPIVQ